MTDRPNILVIMSDQHSRHVIGSYGNDLVRTPHLDRLANQGISFDNAYCPAPLCVPSRMSFMSCRTPSRNRVWHNGHILPSSIPTWAHALALADYETALIGRMHFVGHDQRHGFQQRPFGEFSALPPGVPWAGAKAWTRYPAATTGQCRKAVETAGTGHTLYQWYDDRVVAETCAFLRERSRANRKPFAAVAGLVLPHCPFIAPKPLFDYYYDRVDVPVPDEDQPPMARWFRRARGIAEPPLDRERIRIARAAYFALCEVVDASVGRILDCLEDTGLDRNTLVLYCSDHGEMAGEHGCWWKSNYYEGSVGVPLIARLPGVISPAARSAAVCNLMDIGPTLIDAAGGTPMPDIDGASLFPLLTGKRADNDYNETVSELVDPRPTHTGCPNLPSRMLRTGNMKLWAHWTGHELVTALFNLETDPDEQHDLAELHKYAQTRERMTARVLEDWDPEACAAHTLELDRAHSLISQWGRRFDTTLDDTLSVPPPSVEDDVVLL
jgi:choline-sulfatase